MLIARCQAGRRPTRTKETEMAKGQDYLVGQVFGERSRRRFGGSVAAVSFIYSVSAIVDGLRTR
jgi:hypothetical protein